MSSVDERIVNMKIDNKQLLSGAKTTETALRNLNKSVDNVGKNSGKGMSSFGAAIDGVKQKFSALQVAGVTAIATVTNHMVNAGLRMVKSITIDPIMAGFHEYELNLKSIQTIIANTGASVPTVNKYLGELNAYSDQTIYNFSQMADAIGKFTAAGVKLPTATAAIKGMANVAALSGSSAEQLNGAMYQMSQALAAGRITLMDWNSLVNAGMGGKNVQNALKMTAESFGTNVDGMIKKYGSFRDSLTQGGWLTADTFSKTMKVMAGQTIETEKDLERIGMSYDEFSKKGYRLGDTIAYTSAQLQKMGYSKEAAKELSALSQRSIEAATKIKTFSQMIDVVRESVGSGFSRVFQAIMGDFTQAGKLWTKVGNTITDGIGSIFDATIKMLDTWRSLGGFEDFWGGLGNIFQGIGNLLSPIVAGFQALLPSSKSAGESLAGFTDKFEKATAWFERFTENAKFVTPLFQALGTVLGFVGSVIAGVIGYFTDLIGILGGALPGITSLVQGFQEMIQKFLEWSDLRDRISGFFDAFIDARNAVLVPIVDTINDIAAALGTLFSGDISGFKDQFQEALTNLGPIGAGIASAAATAQGALASLAGQGSGVLNKIAGGLSDAAGKVRDFANSVLEAFESFKGGEAEGAEESVGGMQTASASLSGAGEKLIAIFTGIGSAVKTAATYIWDGVTAITDKLGEWFSGIDKFDLMTVFSYIFSGAVILYVKSFMDKIGNILGSLGDLGPAITGTFEQVTDTLKTMQQGIRSKIILNIAIAVGVLAAALWVLSKVPAKELGIALGAITVMMTQLVASLAVLAKIGGFVNLPFLAASLILMSTALMILAGAVAMLGTMELSTLGKGLGAIAISLGLLVSAALLLGRVQGPLLSAAGSMILMSFALQSMAGAILMYNAIDFGNFVSGLLKMAAALGIMVVAMRSMPTANLLATSVGMMAVATSMVILSRALGTFGGMSIMEISKSLVVLGVSLGLLSMFMRAIQGAVTGAAALIAISVSMLILAGALKLFGNMDVSEIVTSLVVLGIALAGLLAFAGIGAVLGPALMLVAGAVALLGAGAALAGVGMLAFSAGLAALVGIGGAGVLALTAIFQAFLAMLPMVAQQVALAFVAFVEAVAAASPRVAAAFVELISNLLEAVRTLIPQFAKTALTIIQTLLIAIRSAIPQVFAVLGTFFSQLWPFLTTQIPGFVNAAWQMINGFLTGLTQNFPKILQAGVNLVLQFLSGLGQNAMRIVDTAGRMILDFMVALDAAVTKYTPQIIREGLEIAQHLIEGVIKGVGDFLGPLGNAIKNVGRKIIDFFKGVLGINSPSKVFLGFGKDIVQGLINGIKNLLGALVSTARNLGTRLIDGVVGLLKSLPGRAVNALSSLGGRIGGVLTSAFNRAKSIVSSAVSSIGSAISSVPGLISGAIGRAGSAAMQLGSAIVNKIRDGLGSVVNAIGGIGSALIRAVKNALNSALNLPWSVPVIDIPFVGKIGGQTLIPRFAKGTDNFVGGGLAMVGELGPELVSMPGGSAVITNKNLVNFMKSINNLANILGKKTNGTAASDAEGRIVYKVDAGFQGDPKTNGAAFAGHLVSGLVQGLSSGQAVVNKATAGVGAGLTETFSKELGIQSPSKVFRQLGIYVGQGFVNGITRSLTNVRNAGKQMAKMATDTVSKTATEWQLKQDARLAKAQALRDAAELLRAKAKNKKLAKWQKKQLNEEAARLSKRAKNEQKAATAAQKTANAQAAAAAKRAKFNSSTEQGKADMLNADAKAAANRAEAERNRAIKLAYQADLIRKKDRKRARQLDMQAQAALRSAETAARNAKNNAATAAIHASNAAVNSAKAVTKDIDAWLAQIAADEAFEKMTSEEQAAYLQKQADANKKKSDAAIADARAKLKEAEKLAKTNAKEARKLVAAAQKDVEAAKSYKEQADQAAQQAEQLAGTSVAGGGTGVTDIGDLTMPEINIASSAVYDAQNMFDAYTKAMAATTAAASNDTPPVQFIQNNHSPEALSPSEIYRQSKNLLSNAERKLAGAL